MRCRWHAQIENCRLVCRSSSLCWAHSPSAQCGDVSSPSPSEMMTRLSQWGRRFPRVSSFLFVTCSHSDVLVSSHITLHRAKMSHVQKKKKTSSVVSNVGSWGRHECKTSEIGGSDANRAWDWRGRQHGCAQVGRFGADSRRPRTVDSAGHRLGQEIQWSQEWKLAWHTEGVRRSTKRVCEHREGGAKKPELRIWKLTKGSGWTTNKGRQRTQERSGADWLQHR